MIGLLHSWECCQPKHSELQTALIANKWLLCVVSNKSHVTSGPVHFLNMQVEDKQQLYVKQQLVRIKRIHQNKIMDTVQIASAAIALW